MLDLIACAMAAQRTVRVTTVRGSDGAPDVHYVADVLGDRVLAPIGPGPMDDEAAAEAEAAAYAAVAGLRVSRRDVDDYDPMEG